MKWYKPYKRYRSGELKPNHHIPWLHTCCGVYLIRSKRSKEVVYVGHSKSSVYKTLFRHFQDWDDPTQYRATYPKRKYEVALISTKKHRVEKLERFLIARMKPRDAKIEYEDFDPRPGTRRKIKSDIEEAEADNILPGKADEKAPF
jgi:hypothetical protein